MPESFCTAGNVELCFETFGSPDDPALLLVMGLAMQMLGWHEDLCEELAGRGFFVVRYDNRDVGRSTSIDGRPPTTWQLVRRDKRAAVYQLSDMAADGVGLLDHLGISRAHVVGASMGGMIAQTLAAEHPDRVLSLTSIMSNTGAMRSGQPKLGVMGVLLGKIPADREAYLDGSRRRLHDDRLARLPAGRGRAAPAGQHGLRPRDQPGRHRAPARRRSSPRGDRSPMCAGSRLPRS